MYEHMKKIIFLIILSLSSCTTNKVSQGRNSLTTQLCQDCNVLVFNFSSLTKEVFKEYNSNAILTSKLNGLNNPQVFYNHFATSNWPFQSLASFHTGLRVENHRVFNNAFHNLINYNKFNLPEDVISDDHTTMLTHAKKSNYRTIFWGGDPHPSFYSMKTGTMRGADIVENKCLQYFTQAEILSEQLTQNAEKFFAVINIARPHFPHFISPASFKSQFDEQLKSEIFPMTEEDFILQRQFGFKKIEGHILKNPHKINSTLTNQKKVTRDAFWYLDAARALEGQRGDEIFKAHYQKSVEYSFEIINKVIANIKKNNRLEKTLIIITSDVGDNYLSDYTNDSIEFNNRHSLFTYMLPSNESFSVPMFIYYPENMQQPNDVALLTSHIDFLPTVMPLVGYPINFKTDGDNIFSPSFPRRDFVQSFTFRPHSGIKQGFHNSYGTLLKSSAKKSIYYEYQTKKSFVGDNLYSNINGKKLLDLAGQFNHLFEDKMLNEMSKKVDNIYKN